MFTIYDWMTQTLMFQIYGISGQLWLFYLCTCDLFSRFPVYLDIHSLYLQDE